MRLAKIKVSYDREFTLEERATFVAARVSMFESDRGDDLRWKGEVFNGQAEGYNSAGFTAFTVDLDLLPGATHYEIVERPKTNAENIAQALVPRPEETRFNQLVNVVVPDIGVMRIDRCKLVEDCCTDRLNDHLRDGWRILAICPQPDQRRPDYVLGRSGPQGAME